MIDDATEVSRSILIVDDDIRIRNSLCGALSSDDVTVSAVSSAEEALRVLAESRVHVVLTDLKMPGMNGIDLLRVVRERHQDVDVIVMTAHEDLPTVAQATGAGAVDFLVKPLDLHQLRRLLTTTFADRDVRAQAPTPSGESGGEPVPELVGRHPTMVEIFKTVGRVAQTRTTVVIRGESGTGKELVARAIHAGSITAQEPFVAVNCTALPASLLESELFGHVRGAFTGASSDRRGRFATAGRGTIFLDEIGDTTPDFQAKLLRVLQEHEYFPLGSDRPIHTEARVLAATHRDLEARVADGRFREDLYYRLRVVEITVPPLRDRPEDIPLLAEHLIAKVSVALGKPPQVLSPEVMSVLAGHGWPGNVRELENCLTRAAVMASGDVIREEHVSFATPAVGDAPAGSFLQGDPSLESMERAHVARVLEQAGWHKRRAAKLLGISRPRLDRLIARYELEPPDA